MSTFYEESQTRVLENLYAQIEWRKAQEYKVRRECLARLDNMTRAKDETISELLWLLDHRDLTPAEQILSVLEECLDELAAHYAYDSDGSSDVYRFYEIVGKYFKLAPS